MESMINFPTLTTILGYDSLARMMMIVKRIILLLLGKNDAEDENHDDIEDEKYPSLNSSEPLSLWCVASHRVEDVHQHQEQGHQQCHST